MGRMLSFFSYKNIKPSFTHWTFLSDTAIQHWFQLKQTGEGSLIYVSPSKRFAMADPSTLPTERLRAQHRPFSAAAMQYVSSVGAPQLKAQQGKIHLAA